MEVRARLEEPNGRLIDPSVAVRAWNLVDKPKHVITISVDGDRLMGRTAGGRRVLKDILMWDTETGRIVDFLPAGTTREYAIGSFEAVRKSGSKG